MKQAFLKTGAYFLLIPTAVSLLMTGLACLFSNLYFDVFWVTEWLCELPNGIAYYSAQLALFASFGFGAYCILYRRLRTGIICSLLCLLMAAALPMLRYLVCHVCFLATVSSAEMMFYFYEDMTTALYFLVYALAVLLVFWAEKAVCTLILKKNPPKSGAVFSPKHPVGLGALIFFAALTGISLVYFLVTGEFGLENLFSLSLEVVINGVGFLAVTVTARSLIRAAEK